MSDGKRIWRHFQRFAEYNDLKELYSKCIPQLAKFEQKIIDSADRIEQFNHIILQFDKELAKKSDKASVANLKQEVVQNYLHKTTLPVWDQKIDKMTDANMKRYNELSDF